MTNSVAGQTNSFSCESSVLKEGEEFDVINPKTLQGSYELTIVPTWEPKAEIAMVELNLLWEERYVELQADSLHTTLINYPLIGYTSGDFKSATKGNLNDKMSRSDPFDPALRFFTDKNILRFPGGSVDPNCRTCINLNADGLVFEFHFKRNINGTLVGEWTEDFGILQLENSEGKKIGKATGYFCAVPKS